MLIEEYEATLAQRTFEREAAEKRARESNEKYKAAKEKLNEDIIRGQFFYTLEYRMDKM